MAGGGQGNLRGKGTVNIRIRHRAIVEHIFDFWSLL
jgi:hypothetical protein